MSQSLRQICRKVVAVGRNYIEHARELGNVISHDPVVFLKPSSSIIEPGGKIRIPHGATEVTSRGGNWDPDYRQRRLARGKTVRGSEDVVFVVHVMYPKQSDILDACFDSS
ncbi:hypothetical protein FGIG_12542 [Fasciola gigantica]|uniref:oxaloacetate tautomerase n=1 Tax=Fasciola gigantica TaxID=46835 RepID=A0A504YS53_FASGI|nr:hypothetical protein FGIG_12542 [Fasciola gigantica]